MVEMGGQVRRALYVQFRKSHNTKGDPKMGARLQSKVSAGQSAKRGGAVQAASDQPVAQPTAMGDMTGQFEGANFAGVHGNASGSRSKAAPDTGRGVANPAMPGSQPLTAHHEIPAGHSVEGNHPVRSAGRTTQAGDIDKLKTAGS
jgi:hypothetical protein